MMDGNTEAQRLLAEVKFARSEGTMTTLRQLQTEIFKFMRSAKNTKSVSLDDLRVLRSFLRDPFATTRRAAPLQKKAVATTTQEQALKTASQSSQQRSVGQQSGQRSSAQLGDVAESNPSNSKILYYKHPAPLNRDRTSPESRDRSRLPKPKISKDSTANVEKTAVNKPQESHQPGSETNRKRNIPTPAIFANRKKVSKVLPPRQALRPTANTKPSHLSASSMSHRGRYSTYITFPNSKGHTIRQHINEWLGEKGISPRFGDTFEQRLNDKKVIASMINTVDSAVRYSELRIIEDTDGMFTTNITMGTSPDECWIYIEVESAKNLYPQIPRIAKRLISYGTVDNSRPAWHSAAQYIEDDDVDDVINYLVSADRRLPIFLIGTTDDTELINQYSENLKTWFRFLPGAAAMFMLSPSATEEVSERVSGSYSPSPWAIRTYRPNIDLEDEHDASRHRFIGQYRLSTEEQTRTRNRLGMIASEARTQVPRPSVLARAQRTIELARNRALLRGTEHSRDAIRDRSLLIKEESRTSQASRIEQLTRSEFDSYSMLRELLQVDSISEDLVLDLAELYETRPTEEVLARLDGMTEEIAEFRYQTDELRSLNEYYLNEAREFEDQLEQAQARLRFVQKELALAGKPEEAYSFAQHEDIFEDVSSFTDLEQLLPSLVPEGIVFTGDISSMLNIDEIDSEGIAIRRALKSIRCLLSYREERISGSHETGLFHYLQNPTGGFSVPPKMFAPKESESTMNQFGDERQFPVPIEVDPSGWAVMESHFKLGKIGRRSPRMHILDDLANSGNIYIGYVGEHLTIASTN